MNIIQQIAKYFPSKPRTGLSIAACQGKVILHAEGGLIAITPALARKLAAELPALATIAERGFGAQEAV